MCELCERDEVLEEKGVNISTPDKNIRGIVAGIVLLGVVGVSTRQNPDRIIDDCVILLQDFINKNYKN